MAVDLYQEEVFHGATFADMQRAGGPMIIINASDLGYGVRFSFVQEYFDLLYSDINSFPVARAVTASSAVPLLFHPVVVEDYHDCKSAGDPEWIAMAKKQQAQNPALAQILEGLETYSDKENRQYAHFVDASTDPEPLMDRTNKQPSVGETINAMSNVQLHRYNDATLELMQQSLTRWMQALSTPERPVSSISSSPRDDISSTLSRPVSR